MPVIRNFLIIYSLKTGATVSLGLSVVSIIVFLILGFVDVRNVFNSRVIFLYLIWIGFTSLAGYGIYVERSTLLIPELSRRTLFLILDMMSMMASYFKNEFRANLLPMPDIGIQWYTIANARAHLHYPLVVLFMILLPVKIYLFVILLCYYLQLKLNQADEAQIQYYD